MIITAISRPQLINLLPLWLHVKRLILIQISGLHLVEWLRLLCRLYIAHTFGALASITNLMKMFLNRCRHFCTSIYVFIIWNRYAIILLLLDLVLLTFMLAGRIHRSHLLRRYLPNLCDILIKLLQSLQLIIQLLLFHCELLLTLT